MASAKPINIILTTAGLNEIINAEQNGTAPVQLQTVKFSDVHQDISQATTELTNVVATISTISGDSVGDGMIHITVRDVSQDAYTVKAFGIYTDKGTLFGVYSQAEPILQKVGVSIAELAIDFQIHGAQPTSVTFGDVSFLNPPATTEREGVAKIATLNDVRSGLSGNTIVSPAVLSQHLKDDLGLSAGIMEDFASKSLSNTFTDDQVFNKRLIVEGNSTFNTASFDSASFNTVSSGEGSFTTNLTAPTPAALDNSTKVATTAFVKANTAEALSDYASKTNANTFLENQIVNKDLTVKGNSLFDTITSSGLADFNQGMNVKVRGAFYISPTVPNLAINDKTSKVPNTKFVHEVVAANSGIPTGSFVHFAGTAIPPGFLLCNGAAVSRATYDKLFKVIGTKYGAGDGKTTFTLPDLRDRFLEGSTVAGTKKNAGLPNIMGTFAPCSQEPQSKSTGAFSNSTGIGMTGVENRKFNVLFSFDASKSNATYGQVNTVQPKSLTSLILIKF